MAEVVWTDTAISGLDRIAAHIAEDRPKAAERMAAKLTAAALSPEEAPERGRRISNGRRQPAHVSTYLTRYRLLGDRVLVLEIRHGARRPV